MILRLGCCCCCRKLDSWVATLGFNGKSSTKGCVGRIGHGSRLVGSMSSHISRASARFRNSVFYGSQSFGELYATEWVDADDVITANSSKIII